MGKVIWGQLAAAIRTLALADTGSGGLFNVTSPLLNAWYTNEGEDQAALPYAIASMVSIPEEYAFVTTVEIMEPVFQIGVYTEKRLGEVVHQTIISRIRTVFRRVAPTISGYTTSQILIDGLDFHQNTDQALYSAITCRLLVSK